MLVREKLTGVIPGLVSRRIGWIGEDAIETPVGQRARQGGKNVQANYLCTGSEAGFFQVGADAIRRTAVALRGVGLDEIARGQALSPPGLLAAGAVFYLSTRL